jgi:hypothetical protein
MVMPDLEETYFSPILFDKDNQTGILFGTGGESRKGNLYFILLEDFVSGNFDKNIHIDSTIEKGFIAPPIIADINSDGKKDIIVNAVEGKTMAFNGSDFSKIWEVKCEGTEVYAQPAIGNFYGNDEYLDVFVQYAYGKYPEYSRTVLYLIDGKTGEVKEKFEEPRFSYTSPLVVDINKDGKDEVIWNMVTDTTLNQKVRPMVKIKHFDFYNHLTNTILSFDQCANFASTPTIGSFGNDLSTILVCTSPAITSYFPGNTTFEKPKLSFTLHKKVIKDLDPKYIKWANYMGKDGKSHY